MLGAVIRKLQPKRVLEVGCGNGINLLLLAGAFPGIDFAGLDLTRPRYPGGTRNANPIRFFQRHWVPTRHWNRLIPPRSAASTSGRVMPRSMPFQDGAFDLVFVLPFSRWSAFATRLLQRSLG